MEKTPYLIPKSSLTEKSISTASACKNLIASFAPANGLDQASGSPSSELKSELSHKDFKFKTECLPLLYKLSAHPRETVRDWAEEQLNCQTSDNNTRRVLNDRDSSIIFPWRQKKPFFHFSPTRALQLTRHETITSDMARFLVEFRHEAISAKLINYILRQLPAHAEAKLPIQIDQILRQITTTHLPNARRTIAKNKHLNWRVFDELMEKGLPLYSMDAIAHVDWELYSKHATPKSRKETVKHLKRFAKHNPSVARIIQGWKLD